VHPKRSEKKPVKGTKNDKWNGREESGIREEQKKPRERKREPKGELP